MRSLYRFFIVGMLLFLPCVLHAGPRTDLFNACESGDSGKIKELLGADPSLINTVYVDTKTRERRGVLHIAAINRRYEAVRVLLEFGADVMADHGFGMPINFAAIGGDVLILDLLFRYGASVESIDHYLNTPLHLAAYHGHAPAVNFLLWERNANREAINYRRNTALHLAARNDHHKVIEELRIANVFLDAQNIDGATPVHLAALAQGYGALALLIQMGASLDLVTNVDLSTPLHMAASVQNLNAIALLARAQANLFAQDQFGRTPQERARQARKEEAEKLLQHFEQQTASSSSSSSASSAQEATPTPGAPAPITLTLPQSFLPNPAPTVIDFLIGIFKS